MPPKIIIFPENTVAQALDTLILDEVCTIATADYRGYGLKIDLLLGHGIGSVSVAELPDMDNWPIKGRHGQPYHFRVRAIDASDAPAGQALFPWWGSSEAAPRLEAVFVLPEHRRTGLASAMVRFVERVARKAPVIDTATTAEGTAFCESLAPALAPAC
jgi:GNAT superfamily N-acetyltransferase